MKLITFLRVSALVCLASIQVCYLAISIGLYGWDASPLGACWSFGNLICYGILARRC